MPRNEVGLPTISRVMLYKVAEVAAIFWFIALLATTVGETFAGFLILNLNLGLTVTSVVMAALLAVGLGLATTGASVLFIALAIREHRGGWQLESSNTFKLPTASSLERQLPGVASCVGGGRVTSHQRGPNY
jgi:hypothetical protein